ncbi:MAG: hypothetical protein DIAAKJNI_00446 [Candidatus Argoarchaeum ethanivorans]|uniref:Uncharacterized protein n=1 Tax=Candidatus Argoarchaeum ethanivorans TaxID=2608793 RepID=A0A811TA18_9EURY|nr:MAG: hypothetical protein DIAAKJNI_00446 [Candidatus Argoarchaeum ethanivorans]
MAEQTDEYDMVLKVVERVMRYDLERLKRTHVKKRTELCTKIAEDLERFETECITMPVDIYNDAASRFALAKLLLATSSWVNREDNPMTSGFGENELKLVRDFERYHIFDILTIDEAVEKIARKKEGLYELITDYYELGYVNLDTLLDDPSIMKDLKIAFKNRYMNVQHKIEKITFGCIERYGLSWLKSGILVKVAESEAMRERVIEEGEKKMQELESRLVEFESIDDENLTLTNRIAQLEGELLKESMEKDGSKRTLESLSAERDRLLKRFSAIDKVWADQLEAIEARRQEIEAQEKELQVRMEKEREEDRKLLANELKELDNLKMGLAEKENALNSEKKATKLKRDEIEDRLKEIGDVIAGKPLRLVTAEDARLYELNYIARFDTKMHEFSIRIHNPIEDRNYKINSWGEGHVRMSTGSSGDLGPLNLRSVYTVDAKKYRVFGEKAKKVVIEAVSFSHLDEHREYGFDTRRVSLSEFLTLLGGTIPDAEIGQYLHVIGIASPTGWDERVISEIQSKEFAHNYVSRFISVCLVDSITGEVFYNPADERIASFAEFFKPEFDQERVEKVERFVLDRFEMEDYVWLGDVVSKSGEARDIVHRAFCELVDAGGYRMRWIEDVGLVVEIR